MKGSKRAVSLAADHPAIVEGRPLFDTAVHPSLSPRLLVAGFNSRKIGGKVQIGRWKGFPVYTLTLEERVTCPRSCEQWRACYGNNMHWARRHTHGQALETKLGLELRALARKHPRGFVVRLHVLGDFYSPEYVKLWINALDSIPSLHLFGYTARHPRDEIGRGILVMNVSPRCWIRFSGHNLGAQGAVVIAHQSVSEHVVCPAQTGATDCCSTCGLCWTMEKTVEFLQH